MSSDTPAVELVQPSDFWTVERVIDALGASVREAPPKSAQPFTRVWSDTRTLRAGDLFVALSGERFDAHAFVWDAVQAGASGVVISKPEAAAGLTRAHSGRGGESAGIPVFLVEDTRVALGALGTYRRRSWKGTVVGIVGTNGKTSTKELVRAALGSRKRVHATYGNLNNLIGVPQTLLMIPNDADVAVVEMGTNQPGEVATLRAIVEPDVVVVTSIAEEHLEGLGDLAGVMREELSAADGTPAVVVPASQPDVVAEARGRSRKVIVAGLDEGDVRWLKRAAVRARSSSRASTRVTSARSGGRSPRTAAGRSRSTVPVSGFRCAACTTCGTRCSRSPSRGSSASHCRMSRAASAQ
jgi:UDP-N-acetylmuramoyl-tripeptide--D-alanyl-D-alanine ligase